jgi:hypothetical protein
MTAIKFALCILIVSLCVGCSSNQHLWDELERCSKMFNEDCTLVTIPVSKEDQMRDTVTKWKEEHGNAQAL